MVNDLTYQTADFLAEGCIAGYKKGIRKVIKQVEQSVAGSKKLKFSKEAKWYVADFTTEDEAALKNFMKECFEVAGVGSYELQEKLKKLAADVLKEGKGFDDSDFEAEARKIMIEYIPITDQAPSGWLETNFNTAVSSSYSAGQWNRLQDEDVKQFYPAYQYKTRNDDHVRDEHAILHDAVYYNDDPIWDIIMPPNGWNCRCFIFPLDQEETKAADVNSVIRSEEENQNIINQVQPEFRRNPGSEKSIYRKWLDKKYKDMPKELTAEIKKLAKKYAKEFEIK